MYRHAGVVLQNLVLEEASRPLVGEGDEHGLRPLETSAPDTEDISYSFPGKEAEPVPEAGIHGSEESSLCLLLLHRVLNVKVE